MANAAPDSDPDREETDDDPVSEAQKRFTIAEEAWSDNRKLALIDIRFARLEEQWPDRIKRNREADGKPCLTLNQLHGFIYQVVNDARQNKPAITVHPVGDGADVHTAEVYNGLIRHIEQSSDAEVAYDTAMDGAVGSAFGYFRINTRYACDDSFDQDLVIERIADPLSVYPDPYSTAADSSDWNECFILDTMPKAAFEKRWPGKDAVSFGDGEAHRDASAVTDEEMITYAEWWTREEVKRQIVAISALPMEGDPGVDPQQLAKARGVVPDSLIVGMDVYDLHKDLFDALGVRIVGKPRDVTSYKVTQRLMSGADVLEEIAWAGKYIPIVPVYGEELYVEGKRVLRSLIRGAHDGQRMFNYWHSNATEMAGLGPKTPFMGKKGTFETDAAKWATINTENHAYVEWDGEEAPIRPQPPAVPAAAIQMAAAAQANIMSVVGIYRASLGAESNEDSGVAINARDRQADTGTFHYIDNLSRALRHAGRILLDLIPKVYPTPRILRIIQPDGAPASVPVNQPAQFPQMGPDGKPAQDPQTGQLMMIEKTLDLTVGKYDLVVKAGPSFATQREEMVAKLTDLVRADPRLGPIVADIFVKNYDIPEADEIVRRIQAMNPATDPEMAKAKQAFAQLQQENAMLKQKLAGKQADAAADQQYIAVEAYEAETKRLSAILGKDGANPGLDALLPLVAQCIQQIMAAPDPNAALEQFAQAAAGGQRSPAPGPVAQPQLAPDQPSFSGPVFGQAA